MIDQKLQNFLKSLLPSAHLLKSPIKQIKGKVNVKFSPQVNLNTIKIELNPKVNLNKENIKFVP